MSREKETGVSVEELTKVNKALHKVLCETIITHLQDTFRNPGLTEEEIEAAKEFAELKPNTEAVKELLGLLESNEIKEAVRTYSPS